MLVAGVAVSLKLSRRRLFGGLIGLLATPAIVRVNSLMRISVPRPAASLWLPRWCIRLHGVPRSGYVVRDLAYDFHVQNYTGTDVSDGNLYQVGSSAADEMFFGIPLVVDPTLTV